MTRPIQGQPARKGWQGHKSSARGQPAKGRRSQRRSPARKVMPVGRATANGTQRCRPHRGSGSAEGARVVRAILLRKG
ncbi:hypothetical protein GW17_00023233 [Ensete ventricosum]|nr:hypothetical protein GW17_00023233 [Ensete ventricosum]